MKVDFIKNKKTVIIYAEKYFTFDGEEALVFNLSESVKMFVKKNGDLVKLEIECTDSDIFIEEILNDLRGTKGEKRS